MHDSVLFLRWVYDSQSKEKPVRGQVPWRNCSLSQPSEAGLGREGQVPQVGQDCSMSSFYSTVLLSFLRHGWATPLSPALFPVGAHSLVREMAAYNQIPLTVS